MHNKTLRNKPHQRGEYLYNENFKSLKKLINTLKDGKTPHAHVLAGLIVRMAVLAW